MKLLYTCILIFSLYPNTYGQSAFAALHEDDVYKVNQDILVLFNKYLNERIIKFYTLSNSCISEDAITVEHNLTDYELDTASFILYADSLQLNGVFAWEWSRSYKDSIPDCPNQAGVEKKGHELYKFEAIFVKEDDYWIISQIKAPNIWNEEFYFYPRKH